MGLKVSKSDVMNEIINKITMNIMNKNSTTMNSIIDQSNVLTISGNVKTTIDGIEQVNSAIINTKAIQTSIAAGNLQNELIAGITDKISTEGPLVGTAIDVNSVKNIVKNIVTSNITVENVVRIENIVKQKNAIVVANNEETVARSILQLNEASLLAELVAKNSSEITSKLLTEANLETDISSETWSLFDFGDGLGFYMVIIIGSLILISVIGGIISLNRGDDVEYVEIYEGGDPMKLLSCGIPSSVLVLMATIMLSIWVVSEEVV